MGKSTVQQAGPHRASRWKIVAEAAAAAGTAQHGTGPSHSRERDEGLGSLRLWLTCTNHVLNPAEQEIAISPLTGSMDAVDGVEEE